MRAAVLAACEAPLALKDVPLRAGRADRVALKVVARCNCRPDLRGRTDEHERVRPSRRVGQAFRGEVAEAGALSRWKPGDRAPIAGPRPLGRPVQFGMPTGHRAGVATDMPGSCRGEQVVFSTPGIPLRTYPSLPFFIAAVAHRLRPGRGVADPAAGRGALRPQRGALRPQRRTCRANPATTNAPMPPATVTDFLT